MQPQSNEEAKKGIYKDIKAYKALRSINSSDEMNAFVDLLIQTVAQKIIWAFTTDNIKTWDDFCKIRGEIIAYLYPVQEVRGADAMIKHLEEQLNNLYPNPYKQ